MGDKSTEGTLISEKTELAPHSESDPHHMW